MLRLRPSIRVRAAAAAAAAALVAGCGGGSSAGPTTTTAPNGATVPKTVYGSLPTPADPGTKTQTRPATPSVPRQTPRSVYGSLPVPSIETRPGTKRGAAAPGSAAASVTFVVRGG